MIYIPYSLFINASNISFVHSIVSNLENDVGTAEDFKSWYADVDKIKRIGEIDVYNYILAIFNEQ